MMRVVFAMKLVWVILVDHTLTSIRYYLAVLKSSTCHLIDHQRSAATLCIAVFHTSRGDKCHYAVFRMTCF